VCPNKCSDCFGKEFHGTCTKKCQRPLICNHQCQENCCVGCPTCELPCEISCSHSKCPMKCGEICTKCIEPCQYACIHSKCSKKCFEPCDRDLCYEKCDKTLNCGHACIGFCGEPCPKVCRVEGCEQYDKDTFEIFFGEEQSEDSKFILLEDCNHVIESRGLEGWIISSNEDDTTIKFNQCPRCRFLIKNC
jgi:hypothetical protein